MRRELGHPGHFIGAADCLFRRHTHTREYCVSTVGEWRIKSSSVGFVEIGPGRLYETMVFKLTTDDEGCCPRCPHGRYGELEFRAYNAAKDANIGHDNVVQLMMDVETR